MRVSRRLVVGGLAALVVPRAGIAQVGQQPGDRFAIDPRTLPAPYASPSASNPPRRVARPEGAALRVPPGFVATLFSDALQGPRNFAIAPNGDVFVVETFVNRISVLRAPAGAPQAAQREVFVEGLRRPHGVQFFGDHLYVADLERVWRIPYQAGDLKASARPEAVTEDGQLGAQGGHFTRNLIFAPDGTHFFVAIGSAGNIGEEAAPRASVVRFRADGSNRETVVTGTRNPVGLSFRPGTDELWTVVNERDGLGDGLVPDYLARVVDGAFYGWPYAYIGPNPQPGFAERRPDLVAQSRVPDLLFESHSAPIGLAFYGGTSFPAAYRGDAFVALRGSWNAERPLGYVIARVPFRDGRPVGHYETFAAGFWVGGAGRADVWGRPAGVAVAADGALLIADDTGNTIWRVQWQG
jgi:glucose/arabinose dehydrogenase